MIVAGFLCAVVAVYIAGYIAGSPNIATKDSLRFRCFDYRWIRSLYLPAAWVESQTTGATVVLHSDSDTVSFGPGE
jgi:hypothetical protein